MPVALRCEGVRFPVRALKADASRLLVLLGHARAELSVLLCDDAFIAQLNRQYRQKDGPTDVLSFAMDDEQVLGDVVISLDTARRQAETLGHPLDDELRVLLVHGCLHLLGHDHEAPGDDARMAAEEARCLGGLGFSAPSLVSRVL
ncbi:MAG: rRNA maturation RNase YbeY [Deltaproteobacteria bacterium]|nr:rRNA maturation RNase YbeY [Deltaproteobacteria bacterium]